MNSKLTLTVHEILDLARFAGIALADRGQPDGDDLDAEIEIRESHADGALDEDIGERIKTRYVAVMAEYPEEGCHPLGKVLA